MCSDLATVSAVRVATVSAFRAAAPAPGITAVAGIDGVAARPVVASVVAAVVLYSLFGCRRKKHEKRN